MYEIICSNYEFSDQQGTDEASVDDCVERISVATSEEEDEEEGVDLYPAGDAFLPDTVEYAHTRCKHVGKIRGHECPTFSKLK